MVTTVIEAAVFAVTLCGVLALTYALALLFTAHGAERETLILFRRGDKNCAGRLYAARLRLSVFCFPEPCRVFGVDCGMSEEERRLCRALCRQCGGVALLTPEELIEMLTKGETSG